MTDGTLKIGDLVSAGSNWPTHPPSRWRPHGLGVVVDLYQKVLPASPAGDRIGQIAIVRFEHTEQKIEDRLLRLVSRPEDP